jgi:phage terminase large subunit-like protein
MATATAEKPKSRKGNRLHTLGPWVSAWMEKCLVHSEGDYHGAPVRLRQWQRDFLDKCYRIEPDGRRVYDRVVLGLPKGNGKTELAAAIAVAELCGPVVFAGWDDQGRPLAGRRKSPDIPVAASSLEQANTLFGSAKEMIKGGPLNELFECFDLEVYPKAGPGSMYRVAAVAGPNDGARPTFFVADEVHEWEGKKERVHLVLSNGRAKRKGAWELSISTAGWDPESLLARLCDRGRAGDDPRFLYVWYEADADLNIEDTEQRAEAIRQANPAAGDFLDAENIEARYHEIPEHEFRRYYLNQWTSVPEQWIEPEVWSGAADLKRKVPEGEDIALGFDGSYTQDSTALVGCTIKDPHLFLVGLWERPEGVKEWRVDEAEVEAAILEACAKYKVRWMPSDDTFGRIWSQTLMGLVEKGVEVVEWPTRSPSRMAPACGLLWGAIRRGAVTHDGSPGLTDHFMNCRTKTDRFGPRIVKDYKGSKKHIDAAVAAVIAHDMVLRAEDTSTTITYNGL